jgi:hypothetical protein
MNRHLCLHPEFLGLLVACFATAALAQSSSAVGPKETTASSRVARMTFDKTGNRYGTTAGGGGTSAACPAVQGCGTVFKLTRATNGWAESIVYRFKGSPADGFQPFSPVLLAGPAIFGTTTIGGTVTPNSYGTVFQNK